MMTGMNAITVHGYAFEEPKPALPAPTFSLTPYIFLAAGIWWAWRKGWLHSGKGPSPKLQSGGDAGGGIA